jgi:xylulokinase
LPIRVLPALRRPGDLAGSVTSDASAQTGIPAGTPVITGVGDTLAALLGAGVVRRSEALLYYGTTATADVCTCDIESYLLDPSSVARGAPYTEVAYALLGPALRWAARGFGDEDPGALLEPLDTGAQALGTRVDAPYVLPFFMDRPPSGHSTQQPAIVGLDIGHSRSHLHRALLESFGYVIRSGLEGSGYDVSAMPRFVASGGGAASGPWRQIVSDVLGVEQAWGPDLDGALGDAMLAAWATGRLDTFGNGLAGWQKDVCETVPDSHAVGIHRVRYETWKRLASAVAGAYAPGSSPG